jgi:hypothetical protein
MSCTIDTQNQCIFLGEKINAKQVILGFDITGGTIEVQFRKELKSGITWKWSTTDSTITITDASTGTFIRPKVALNYPIGVYYGDWIYKQN